MEPTKWTTKPLEYWAVIIGMAIWVFTSTSQMETLARRLLKTLLSALLGFGLSDDLGAYLGVGEGPAAVAIMAFGLIFLDTATTIAADRKFVADIIRKRLGGGQ